MQKKRQRKAKDPASYKRQVKTFLNTYGRRGYVLAGRQGGGANSPGSFTSETASAAAKRSWEVRRQKQAEQLEKEASDGGSTVT